MVNANFVQLIIGFCFIAVPNLVLVFFGLDQPGDYPRFRDQNSQKIQSENNQVV